MTAMESVFERDLRYLKGIGEKRAGLFHKLGLFTLRDLLSHFPRDYEDRTNLCPVSALQPELSCCVSATVIEPVRHAYIREGMELFKTRAADETGAFSLTFFNAPYVKTALKQGETYIFYGKASGPPFEMTNPVFETEGNAGMVTGCILPRYRLCAGLSRGLMVSAVRQALELCLPELAELLPEPLRARWQLAYIRFAYQQIHFPESFEALDAARKRLVFEELLLLSLGLSRLKQKNTALSGAVFSQADLADFYAALPFAPTGAQKRAIEDAVADMTSGRLMNRLVQGDVGSGKTLVAAACAVCAARSGYQTALMAPTEILAEQHVQSLAPLFETLGVRPLLLTGGMTAKTKKSARQALAVGTVDVAIGTHALLSEEVVFARLGLTISDEQHRFGVAQRASLSAKGQNPHMLVMSATPIPRTLALIVHGDLDVSLIDELPPGRQPVDTFVVDEEMRPRIVKFTRRLVIEGRQVYIVCPLVEEGESDLHAAEKYTKNLREKIFPDLRVGMVHGRMKAKAKEAVMRAFAAGELDILVATTVIEVGVNVPNACLMVVENAERFGLSQLHQLRGRVGRGAHKSYCVLFSGSRAEPTLTRLSAMRETNDGFEIARRDLALRGPGDFFGSRQHGLPQLKIADLSTDAQVLPMAHEAAREILKEDPQLTAYPGLRREVERLMEAGFHEGG